MQASRRLEARATQAEHARFLLESGRSLLEPHVFMYTHTHTHNTHTHTHTHTRTHTHTHTPTHTHTHTRLTYIHIFSSQVVMCLRHFDRPAAPVVIQAHEPSSLSMRRSDVC